MTLAIIGVVAALTIPAVITKATKDQYVVGLKKAYNTLKSVERESIQDNGEMKYWAMTYGNNPTLNFDKYFKPYFDIIKDCGTGTEEACVATTYKNLSDGEWDRHPNTSYYAKIIASDGLAYFYMAESIQDNHMGYIWVDVNGTKGPNIYGRDLFRFNVFKDRGIVPGGGYSYETNKPITTASMLSGCKSHGGTCAALVLSEGAMNY